MHLKGLEEKIVGSLRSLGFDEVKRDKSIRGYRCDIYARSRETGRVCVIELRRSQILMADVFGLIYCKEHLPKPSCCIAFSPQGTREYVNEVAKREGVFIVSSLDELERRVRKYLRE
jgi:hypothetical protein